MMTFLHIQHAEWVLVGDQFPLLASESEGKYVYSRREVIAQECDCSADGLLRYSS